MPKPLEGVTVLDFTKVLSGPYATMLLYNLGAKVIKVEKPNGGDDARVFEPISNGESLYFAGFNCGKQSLSVDLKTGEGKQIIKSLIAGGKIDVIVENFRPGTMEKLGLGYDTLKALNPKIIYAAISGFGHTGPDSANPAYDIIAQARSGIMSITGHPGNPPTRIGASYGDMTAGIFAALGIVSALYQRQITGQGQQIDISMLDCQTSMLENAITMYQTKGKSPEPLGNSHPSLVPFQAFKASDKYFVVAAPNDTLWNRLEAALNIAHNPRFATLAGRYENKDELIDILQKLFLTNPCQHWLSLISEAGIPCAPIANIADLMQDKQLYARGMFVPIDGSNIKIAGNPIKMNSIPEPPTYPKPPKLGQDNFQILQDFLGLSPEEITNLTNKGVL